MRDLPLKHSINICHVMILNYSKHTDFDGVSFHVSNPDGEKSKIRVSLDMYRYLIFGRPIQWQHSSFD